MSSLLNKFVWGIFFLSLFSFIFYFSTQKVQLAGDIAEYYGITESILSHGSVNLTPSDQSVLSKKLHPEYFNDPGYYLVGHNSNRFPVHFIFYSILVIPIRLILRLFSQNELLSLTFTNILLTFTALFLIFRCFIKNPFSRLVLLIILMTSPFISFLSWPGPDVFYFILVLLSLFLFNKKHYLLASTITAIASWHSQPLIILSIFFATFHFFTTNFKFKDHRFHLTLNLKTILIGISILFILSIPYFYNLYAFSALTPWTIFKDGWTQISGFGPQNISLKRTFEQFFDLNMGLFWYAPLITIVGLYYWIRSQKINRWLFLPVILTILFYQTNPGWNFGTAGFGPSRHIIFIIPFLIYFLTISLKPKTKNYLCLTLIIVSQIFILSSNGLIHPNFENSLKLTPLSKYILNHYPQYYNPTPEIFIDRTNHTDNGYPTTAIYKNNGICRKAYVLITDKDKLISQCSYIPDKYLNIFNNDFLNKTSFSRTTITTEATFWPDTQSCEDWYQTNEQNPYLCLKTLSDFIKNTSINDPARIESLGYPGVWHLKNGLPQKIIIPPGYIINHYSLTGVYVNY
ncbi:MAG: hypothetical protein PHX34_03090 [Candidatus Shapirobacteria bacterium]|nr:hypothetical protein [Candidatus Shapirobacteria bacterium]